MTQMGDDTDRPLPRTHAPLTTAVSESDAAAGVLRYRGVDVRDLVGTVPFDRVWGLLVADDLRLQLPPAETFPLPARTGDMGSDVLSALASVPPVWGFRSLEDIDDEQALEDLARTSVLILSFVAQSARGPDLPVVPQRVVHAAGSVAERFLTRWRGEADPRHVEALDAYFVTAAEHGFSTSTHTARLVASTGADVATCLAAAVAASSGPRMGGSPARALRLLQAVDGMDDPRPYVRSVLDSGTRLAGFGHSVYDSSDPRVDVLKSVCRRLDAPLYEAAVGLESVATELIAERSQNELVPVNLELWVAVLLSCAEVPGHAFGSVYACARSAGWSAHILEQKRSDWTIRPVVDYVGRPSRSLRSVTGWDGAETT